MAFQAKELSVHIHTCDYTRGEDEVIDTLIDAVYTTIRDNKLGRKCVGVMKATIDDTLPIFLVSISGYSLTIKNKPPKDFTTEVEKKLINAVSHANKRLIEGKKLKAGTVAAFSIFETKRALYATITQTTPWDEVRRSMGGQEKADMAAEKIRDRYENYVKRIRTLGGFVERNDTLLAAEIEKHFSQSVWSARIPTGDENYIIKWFIEMARCDAKRQSYLDNIVTILKEPRAIRDHALTAIADRLDNIVNQSGLNDVKAAFRNELNALNLGSSTGPFECTEEEVGNLLAMAFGALPDPRTSKILDVLADCAEDNACIDLLDRLKKLPKSPTRVVIEWYSTERVPDPNNKAVLQIRHKQLCPVCDVRFVERLNELIRETWK
ncbi:hypothetical protein HDU88_005150 [Geranomyces variabilis]|nr:hypothetical protein HDU88_005150 [Geranomyces variabilis]